MPQSLPDTTTPKRRFRWPTGMPQLVALLLVLLVDSLVAPHFWQVVLVLHPFCWTMKWNSP